VLQLQRELGAGVCQMGVAFGAREKQGEYEVMLAGEHQGSTRESKGQENNRPARRAGCWGMAGKL
jgi:hypothetical protein